MTKVLTTLLLSAALLLAGHSASAQIGTLDSDFDGDGIRIDSFDNNTSDVGQAVVVLPDNKVLVAGYAEIQGDKDIVLLKYNTDGSPDMAFSGDGKVSFNLGTGYNDVAHSLALQPDGKILIAATTDNASSSYSFVVLRLRPDGVADSSFGTAGYVTIATGSSTAYADYLSVNNATGTIAVGGSTSGALTIYQLHADGSMDNNFGTAGRVTLTPPASYNYYMAELAYGPDGKIVTSGQYYFGSDQQFYTNRLNTDGTPDQTFSVDGIVTTLFSNGSHDNAYAMLVQADGKIVVGGYSTDGVHYSFAVLRYDTDGTLDLTFNGTGKNIITSPGTDGYVLGLAQASDGKYLLGGLVYASSAPRYAVVRLYADGRVDSTFGTDGLTLTNIHNVGFQQANAIAQAPNGRIVQTGGAGKTITESNIATVRYLSGLHIGIQDLSTAPQGALIYPSPLQPTETLRYALATDERVTIQLYSLDGRLVQTLLTGQPRTAGAQSETLSIPDTLPAGAYILRLTAGTVSCAIQVVK